MAYNPSFYFPQHYSYQMPVQQMPQQPVQQPIQQPQMMTPPTVHAEIIQVENESVAENYPVAAGASQMMMLKDDSAIYIKTAYANGQTNMDIYLKQAKTAQKAAPDLSEYVTKQELEERLSGLFEHKTANKSKEVPET